MGDELHLRELSEALPSEAQASEREQEYRQQTPERGRDTRNNATQAQRRLSFSPVEENEEGKWLQNHPWQDRRPDLQMDDVIEEHNQYPLPKQWKDPSSGKINLRNLHTNLPEFVKDMRGKSEREMLKQYFEAKTDNERKSKMTAHMREIIDELEDKKPKDKASDKRDQSYKAYSLKPANHENQQKGNVRYLDCEYILKMYLPENRQTWFTLENTPSGLIRMINGDKKDKRWIFTPSFRRAEIALLDWPRDEIVTEESTIRILVVRPSEFEKYVEQCGHMFPIISLPNDEIGAGYARLWIQKIALRLKLDFIWMIDDSVECFYEYHPDSGPDNYTNQRRRQFGLVFERIEGFFKLAENIAAVSPRGTPPGRKVSYPFTSKPPQAAVYLNLTALKKKEVFHRPEFKFFEDMMFGYECHMNGLHVFRDNRVQLQDHRWKDTGAMSPSVRPQESE